MTTETRDAIGTLLQVIKHFKLDEMLNNEVNILEKEFFPNGTGNLPDQLKRELKAAHGISKLGTLIFAENPYVRQTATKLIEFQGRNGGYSGNGSDISDIRERLKAALNHVPMELVLESPDLGSEVEAQRDNQEATWAFRGTPYQIRRALRIPYCYTDEFGSMVEEHLLIGYEGRSGY